MFINPHGGTAAARGEGIAAETEEAFAAAGHPASVRLVAGCDMAEAVRAAADAPVVVVGGGDGTLGCAAGALVKAGGRAALGILPFGTRNHLAGELGIPADPAEAVRLILSDARRRIDVGRVADHVFINNASIGLYPALVRRREAVRRRTALPKWIANLPAAWTSLKRARHHRLRLVRDGEASRVRTPLLFIGNDVYSLDPKGLGKRERLDEGVLSVFAVASSSRLELVRFVARTRAGRGDTDKDYAAIGTCRALDVHLHGRAIGVALDGEVMHLDGPLRFTSDAGALTVIAPPAHKTPA